MAKKFKIEEAEVQVIVKWRDEVKAFEDNAAALKDQLSIKEKKLFDDLKRGGLTDHLPFIVTAKTLERRYPAWKNWFVKHMGEAAAAKILAKTEPTQYPVVVIKKKIKIA